MKVVIFGASGATGRELVQQALAAGHEVTAFVRDPSTTKRLGDVHTVQGDVRDRAAVSSAIDGQDAVLSALGARSLKERGLLESAMANIIAGMTEHGVRRIVVLGAAGALHDANKYQSATTKLVYWIIRRTLLKNPLDDQAAQERLIEASDLAYTMVYPPRLTNGPRTSNYRVQGDGLPPHGSRIARADVAEFMVKELEAGNFVRQGPYIAT